MEKSDVGITINGVTIRTSIYVSYIYNNLIYFKSGIGPKFYSRYVDDVFVIYLTLTIILNLESFKLS